MKIIKRDGRAVDYNREKIQIAIEKANTEVREVERASKEDIKGIIKYIEDLGKKRMLVEDIQDIIEQKLMELQKYELAKRYIVYRYTRALVRKQNTTDESILGLIKEKNRERERENSKKNAITASTQRDLIAGEVSKDLTKRMLLPEKISKAHDEGILYFHDADYFLQPIFNCSLINLEDMLNNGTVINGILIESPQTFLVACTIMTQIIACVASNQYGEQAVNVKHLGKYLRKKYYKIKEEINKKYKNKLTEEIIEDITQSRLNSELKQGIQTIQYELNTLITANGQSPNITLFLNIEKDDPYIKENAIIIEEILKQRYQGVKDETGEYITPEFPKLIYVLDEYNCLKGGKYDYLTRLAIKCSLKTKYPYYISAKQMREQYEGNVFSPMGENNFLIPTKDEKENYKFEGRFNQGIVSINLPQIGIIEDGNENKFWDLLDERLELCYEALMCRHYALLGTTADISPIHWKYGAISRLKQGEKIDKLLYGDYSSISLGYVGIYELTKIIKGTSNATLQGQKFAIKVIERLKEKVDEWRKRTNIGFTLYGVTIQNICYRFAEIDKEKFGEIKDITDKGYYTNSYHINSGEQIDLFEKLEIENKFQKLSTGGGICYIDLSKDKNEQDQVEDIIKFIYENILYAGFNLEESII